MWTRRSARCMRSSSPIRTRRSSTSRRGGAEGLDRAQKTKRQGPMSDNSSSDMGPSFDAGCLVVRDCIVRGDVGGRRDVLIVVPVGGGGICGGGGDLHPQRVVHDASSPADAEGEDVVAACGDQVAVRPFKDDPLVVAGEAATNGGVVGVDGVPGDRFPVQRYGQGGVGSGE